MLRAFAATKASTTPEPTPTSSTNGGATDDGNRSDRKADSLDEDSVSSSKYESSAGSYTRSKQTCEVEGVGSILSIAGSAEGCSKRLVNVLWSGPWPR